jgi:hypothetical protein
VTVSEWQFYWEELRILWIPRMFVPELSCSVGYGSVGELETSSDWVGTGESDIGGRTGWPGWLDGEECAKALWLVVFH